MNIRLVAVITLVPILAVADIYKSVDSEGHVTFSDQPSAGAKKIQEQTTPTTTSTALPAAETDTPSVATGMHNYYSALRISAPAHGKILRDLTGALTVELVIVPPLNTKQGDKLIVGVDGNDLTSNDNTPQLTISNLASGAHTLKARIVNTAGQEMISSERTTFLMQRGDELIGAGITAKPLAKQPAPPPK